MTKKRSFQPADKVAIIRRHLVEGVPVSDLCDELSIKPTQYYAWQKQFFENGSLAFERRNAKNRQQPNREQKKIEALEGKLLQRNEVVAELLQEHVQLKKELGEL
jgi:transposase-like protein